MTRILSLLLLLGLAAAACSSDADTTVAGVDTAETTETDTETTETDTDTETSGESETDTSTETSGETESFTIEVWADNWMGVYVDGVLVGEDSVSITTERSFNSETFSFEAAYPFTIAIEAKDYVETDSGLEYIGESNQQIGDGGIIAQIKDSSGTVVAVTNSEWASLVVYRAPLNTDCSSSADPDTDCEFEIIDTPSDWTAVSFDDSGWTGATVWSAADVDPKIGYDDITWDSSAELIWGTDLEVDNTVLLRTVVSG